ncbi:MAG TPA: hypothetical protein VFW75_11790 [Acetobacteraceae bacterium]|nr:hypothetical protein [Acetobacteraceae bacterium]
MTKYLGVALAGVAALSLTAGAMGAQQSTRIRGTIEAVNGNTVAIKSYAGKTVDVKIDANTRFASVLPSSLADINSGDFIGAGATGPEDDLQAIEVVIFPDSMRGTGEGHYAWSVPATVAQADSHAGAAAASAAPPVQGTMTNGTVASSAPAGGPATAGGAATASGAPPVQGTMTNGTIAANTGTSDGKELTVSFNGGKQVKILVPPGVPVVRFAPAQHSVLTPGAKAFVVANRPGGGSELSANFVAVGKNGLMPPM